MIFKGLCLFVAICLAATLAVQAAEVSVQGIDVKLARDPTWKAVPDREFAQLRWATEKEKFNKNHANKLVAFGVYRTFYVTNLLRKVVQSMGIGENETVVVNAMGSTNPTSDYDVTIDHSRADQLATRFNSEFESQWGETSADVFDTNIYPVGWVLDKRAWGGRAPFCTHQLADTASSEHGANDVTVRGYEEFKPKAEFDSMRKRFEAATTIWGLVKAQYQINVLGAEMFKDHIAGVNCKKTQAPVTNRGMCMLMHYFKTTALNNINWRVVGAPVEATDAAAGSMLSTPLYMRGKQTIDAVMTQSVIKLRDLMTQPCSDPAFNRTCCNTYYASERKMYESAIKMNNMKCRNRMYEKWATIVYNKLRGAGTCNYDAWFNLVEDIRVAEFYGAETYYTEGAFFKTVLAEQALVPSLLKDNPALERFKGLKISRVEILSSLLENFADFVKELGHSVHEHWNQTETVVQASKYMKRLLTAARDIIDTSPGADSAGNVLHDELAAVLKESSKPTEELASKIRGKAMTPELIAIRDRNVAILEAVYDKLAGNYRAVINSKNPERTHIPAWYRASMALTARMLDYFILVNESNPAYHSSYVMYDGSQHNGGSSGSSKSSSSSSSSSSSTRGRPSPIGKRKPGSKPLNPGF